MMEANVLPANTEDMVVVLKKKMEALRISQPPELRKISRESICSRIFIKGRIWLAQWNFYVDLLVRGVTEKFIEITVKGYEKIAGKDFGKTVPGVFSDEPEIMVQGSGNVRWTPDLFSAFRQKWGYDLQTHLPSLFEETGDWKKIRHNYQQTLLQLFIERWSKPMHDYMEKHRLKWTGHYWEHGWPEPHKGPDNMAMYAWHQQPGLYSIVVR